MLIILPPHRQHGNICLQSGWKMGPSPYGPQHHQEIKAYNGILILLSLLRMESPPSHKNIKLMYASQYSEYVM